MECRKGEPLVLCAFSSFRDKKKGGRNHFNPRRALLCSLELILNTGLLQAVSKGPQGLFSLLEKGDKEMLGGVLATRWRYCPGWSVALRTRVVSEKQPH